MVSLSTALFGAFGLGVSVQAGSTIAGGRYNRVYRALNNWETSTYVIAGIILAVQGAQIIVAMEMRFGLVKFALLSATHGFWACGGLAVAIFFGDEFAKWSSEELHKHTKPQVALEGAFKGAEFKAAPFQKNMEMWAIGQIVCSVALLALSINPYFQVINITLQLAAIASMAGKQFVQLNYSDERSLEFKHGGVGSGVNIEYYMEVFIITPAKKAKESGQAPLSSIAISSAAEGPISPIQICQEHQKTIFQIGEQMTERLEALAEVVRSSTALYITHKRNSDGRYEGDSIRLITKVSRSAVSVQCQAGPDCHPILMEIGASIRKVEYNTKKYGHKSFQNVRCGLFYTEDLPVAN